MDDLNVRQSDEAIVFTVKAVAGSSKTAIVGVLGGMLKIKLVAAPEKGKANQCLIQLLAESLNVSKKAVSIVSGVSSSVKHVQIDGVSVEELNSILK